VARSSWHRTSDRHRPRLRCRYCPHIHTATIVITTSLPLSLPPQPSPTAPEQHVTIIEEDASVTGWASRCLPPSETTTRRA